MPRRDTPPCAGEHYHFYNRGNDRQPVFYERENYLFFLRRVGEYLSPVLDVVAYCLMPTHYHLVIGVRQTSDFSEESDVSVSVSRAMQRLGISFTKAMNKRYERTGALFQGGYRSKHVGKNEYLVHLSRYLHLNPVIDGLVERPEEWEFSSYREYVGLRDGTLPRPRIVLEQFTSARAYAEFVHSYMPEDRAKISDLL
jgi:REP element-mobilizing transposase RayT